MLGAVQHAAAEARWAEERDGLQDALLHAQEAVMRGSEQASHMAQVQQHKVSLASFSDQKQV